MINTKLYSIKYRIKLCEIFFKKISKNSKSIVSKAKFTKNPSNCTAKYSKYSTVISMRYI